MPREELKSRMRAETKAFNLMLEHAIEERDVLAEGYRVLHPTHKPKLSENQAARWKELKDRFESSRYSPPSVKECIEAIGDEMMNFLFNQGELIKVSEDVVFEVETYKQMVEIIREKLNAQLEITVAEVRDIFRTSRKYALALMEHLDGEGVTVREGDARRLA
jgi:selenocysteine-specific elongation factor